MEIGTHILMISQSNERKEPESKYLVAAGTIWMVYERLLAVRLLQVGVRRRFLCAEHRVQVRSLEEGLDGALQSLVTRHYGWQICTLTGGGVK